MIRTIHIKNFRGFQDFRLEGLNELTILTGRNGCGKSTVLDALLVGAAPNPAEAVGIIVERHPKSRDGARWLFNNPKSPIEIQVDSHPAQVWPRFWLYSDVVHFEAQEAVRALEARERRKPFRQILSYDQRGQFSDRKGFTVFDLQGSFESLLLVGLQPEIQDVKLIDPAVFSELADSYSKLLATRGLNGKKFLLELLKPLVPDVGSIEVLTGDTKEGSLALAWSDKAVPLSFVGDGLAAIVQIGIQASLVEPGGTVLIEEPEVFLHPRGLSVVAGLLLELMRQGRQVIITTHSLELIDSLLGTSEAADLEKMALFNMRPTEGEPTVVKWSGREFEFVREQIGDDLR